MNLSFRNRIPWFAACMLLATAPTLTVHAQTMTQGAISGTVFDATDAAIPGAIVAIHNDGTGTDLTLKTGGAGEYRAPQLPPGSYTVTISAPGFTSQRKIGVVVLVNQTTEVVPHLTNGSSTETVEVSGEIPTINLDSAVFGGHLETREIENIPINNRRWSSLALTTPGVTNDASGFGLLSFRALPSVLNNVQIDGVDDNQAFYSEERGRTRAGYSTSQVAVREFQVNTGVYSAELGRAAGGVVNSVTKTGSNQLHGEVYFYHRGDDTSSKNPNTKLTSSTGATTVIRPKDKRNQYGFGAGGYLIKDKLFWFYAFDAYRRNFPGIAVSGAPAAFNAATVCGTANLLTSTGATLAQCQAAFADLAGTLGLVPRFGNQLINTPKLTWVISPKHTLNVYYHRLRWDSPGGVQTQAALAYSRDAFGTDFVKLDYGVATLNSVLGSHFSNELRYQYARELNDEGQQPLTSYTASHLVSGNNVTYATMTSSAGGFNLGSPYYSYRVAYPDERKWQIGDTAAYNWGKHTIRFGVDFVHNYDLQNTLGNSSSPPTGVFAYTSPAFFLADILKPGGACAASAVSGNAAFSATGTANCYNSFNQAIGPSTFDLATLDSGYFVQDDWKLMPSLTLNLGVRYDYQDFPAPYSNLITASQTASRPADKNNVSARLGFAYDPFGQGKTVLRGGFGMYYGRIPNSTILSAYVGTGSANAQSGYTVYNGTDLDATTTGLQNLKFPNVLTARPSATASAPSISYLDSHLQTPYTEQFTLQFQQDLGLHNVLSVSYMGALGRELPNYLNFNLDPSKAYNLTYTFAANTSGVSYGSVAGKTFTQRVYSSKYTNGTTNTLNTSYNAITDVLSNANSSYNAVTVDITNRQWKFISYDVNYTWAHALDYNVASVTTFGTNNWLDPYANPRSNYGNSSINIRHRAVGWAIINIPGMKRNDALSYVTNGWSIKPLVQIQSGLPYSYAISSGSPASQSTGCSTVAPVTCLSPYSSGIAGTGVSSYIPFLGRNTLMQPRNIVVDMRLQKDFRVRDGMTFQLLAEGFNLANHQNITGVNTGAFTLSGTTLTSVAATANFGQASTSGVNSNYAYQVRQFQFGGRLMF
ncbi:MAG: TonB-dependent receptor [Acidobacteriaceae bacterium]|nr:TonB-dependent receptor [Acidobacteriaceae bacterium]